MESASFIDTNDIKDTEKMTRDCTCSDGLVKHQLLIWFSAFLIGLIAVIISIVSLTNNQCVNINMSTGTAFTASQDDKVWMFAIGHSHLNIEYIDEVSGEVRGFDVDLINAVCRYANKNCRLVLDVYERCWNSVAGEAARGGDGLFGRYYDACAAWLQTYERSRVFQFTDPWSQSDTAAFYVKKGNPRQFNWLNLTEKKIGFIDGIAYNEHCVARDNRIKGNKLSTEQIILYHNRDDLITAILNDQIDAGFDTGGSYENIDDVEKTSDDITACIIGGLSMMTLKDSQLPQWWNPAQKSLMQSKEYRDICDDLKVKHGHWPGPSPDNFCLGY